MSILKNHIYINKINRIKDEINDLLDNNIGHINNINKIISLGDLHGDMEILLKFLKKIGLIDYKELDYKELDYNKIDKYYYHYIYDNNNNCILYLYNEYNNTNNIINYDKIYNYPLYIKKCSYYNIDENEFNSNNDYNNYYKIIFNINNLKEYKNTLFVLLGDITDSHYEKHDFNYKYRKSIYVNDIGCYQIVLFLKNLINKISNENNMNTQLRILFGNHEFYELFRNADEFISAIEDLNNDNKYEGLNNILFPNKEYTINGFVYTLDDEEYKEYQKYIIKDEKNNLIGFKPEFKTSKIKNILNLKFKRRKNIILNNLKDIDFIIIVNNQILLSHTFLFKKYIIDLKKIISKTDDNDKYYLQNNTEIDEVILLNILSKYILHKLKNNQINKNEINDDNNIIISLFNILNGRNPLPYKYIDKQTNKKNNELYPNSILCNANNYNNINENFINTSCQNKIHIVGHMPQFNINRQKYINEDNIKNVPIYNDIEYLHKPYFTFNKNINQNTNKINSITAIPYDKFYLYYNDNHLSLSFSDNKDDYEKDLDHYYYLELNIDNNNNITRRLIQFNNPDILL